MISAVIFELKKHRLAYALLIVGLLVLGGLYMLAWPDTLMIRLVSIALGIFYASWGILAHTKSKTVTPAVVAEYLAISLLAVLVLLLITW